ncbi:unnamed protein product [Sympodiomycopsis kandeliae]
MATPKSIDLHVQQFFQKAVDDGLAPTFQWAVFDKDEYLSTGAVGSAALSDAAQGNPGQKMTEDHLLWVASCGKLGMSIVILHILEKGLAKDGSTLKDLDDPSALLRLLPEFTLGSKHWVTKLVTGFEPKQDPTTGELIPITVDKKTVPTFRQLLNHTAGLGYYWSSESHVKWWKGDETIGAKPLGHLAFTTGKISDLDTPCLFESGTAYEYSPSLDWLAIWAQRATGKSLIELHEEILFKSLGMDGKALVYVDEKRQGEKSHFFSPNKEQPGTFIEIPFDVWSCDGLAPADSFHFGSAPVWASHKTYSKVIQAAMRQDERLLSKELWEEALSDQISRFKSQPPSELIKDICPDLIHPLKGEFSPGANERPTLLSTLRSTTVAKSGKPANTFSWTGLANSYYIAVSPSETKNGKGFGFMYGSNILPGLNPGLLELRNKLEALFFEELKVLDRK